jgi:membrane associated rhomboid family serine protease
VPAAETLEEEPEVLEELPADLITPGDAPDDLYDLAAPPPIPVSRIVPANSPHATPIVCEAGPPPVCPSCQKTLIPGSKICVDCGIDVKTGRSLITSKELDEDDLAIRADTWIRLVSWILPVGLFPIASEAFATKKPHVTWAITAITILTSLVFFVYLMGNDHPDASALNLMHWTGSREVSQREADGVRKALQKSYEEQERRDSSDGVLSDEARRRAAKEALADSAEQMGAPDGVEFHWYQLLTCAFLHDPSSVFDLLMHLGGNMVFLLVFGLRVNEMVGTARMIALYVLLAVGSSYIHGLTNAHQALAPSLGASGAIMGLAGMYIVFFPVQRVHMAFWLRLRWWLTYKLFTMRGFWLLALWIGFNDLLPMFFKSEDQVAHWAHLGGFILGVVAALTLLLARQVNAGGGDLLSVALGKRAWALLGKPATASALPA